MSVSITLNVEHTVTETGLYQVACTVAASEGVPLALFTYEVTSEAYSHPATVSDLEFYPEGRNEAIGLGLDYYRLNAVTKIFATMTEAISFETVIRSRLQKLANDLPLTQGRLFEGVQTYVITTAT